MSEHAEARHRKAMQPPLPLPVRFELPGELRLPRFEPEIAQRALIEPQKDFPIGARLVGELHRLVHAPHVTHARRRALPVQAEQPCEELSHLPLPALERNSQARRAGYPSYFPRETVCFP